PSSAVSLANPRPIRPSNCTRKASSSTRCRSSPTSVIDGNRAVQIGTFHFPTDYGIEIGELAAALEARGFESLFVCEHTHIPVSRRTPFPGGGELPKRYSHTHDPFVALSFAAAATRTLRVGTGIALMPQRDPIITAK